MIIDTKAQNLGIYYELQNKYDIILLLLLEQQGSFNGSDRQLQSITGKLSGNKLFDRFICL